MADLDAYTKLSSMTTLLPLWKDFMVEARMLRENLRLYLSTSISLVGFCFPSVFGFLLNCEFVDFRMSWTGWVKFSIRMWFPFWASAFTTVRDFWSMKWCKMVRWNPNCMVKYFSLSLHIKKEKQKMMKNLLWLPLGPSHGLALTWHLRMKVALDVARYGHYAYFVFLIKFLLSTFCLEI